MKRRSKTKISLILTCLCAWLVILTLPSCDDYKDCNNPVDTYLGIGFYQVLNDLEEDSTLPALTMYGIGREDSLLADKEPISSVYVPLKQTLDSTSFYICPDSTLSTGDTLTVKYRRERHFVSAGCGFTTFYTLDTVYATRHYIDSIILQTPTINTNNAKNLKIYY